MISQLSCVVHAENMFNCSNYKTGESERKSGLGLMVIGSTTFALCVQYVTSHAMATAVIPLTIFFWLFMYT